MVNFIWFTDEKCSSYQHKATWEHEIRQLNHLASGVCWRTVLLEGVKVKLSLQVCESDRSGHFCGCNGKTNSLSSVNQMKFIVEAGQLFSNCQH